MGKIRDEKFFIKKLETNPEICFQKRWDFVEYCYLFVQNVTQATVFLILASPAI